MEVVPKKREIKNINFTAMNTSNVMIHAKNFDLFGVSDKKMAKSDIPTM